MLLYYIIIYYYIHINNYGHCRLRAFPAFILYYCTTRAVRVFPRAFRPRESHSVLSFFSPRFYGFSTSDDDDYTATTSNQHHHHHYYPPHHSHTRASQKNVNFYPRGSTPYQLLINNPKSLASAMETKSHGPETFLRIFQKPRVFILISLIILPMWPYYQMGFFKTENVILYRQYFIIIQDNVCLQRIHLKILKWCIVVKMNVLLFI